jgi:hypothetical protein
MHASRVKPGFRARAVTAIWGWHGSGFDVSLASRSSELAAWPPPHPLDCRRSPRLALRCPTPERHICELVWGEARRQVVKHARCSVGAPPPGLRCPAPHGRRGPLACPPGPPVRRRRLLGRHRRQPQLARLSPCQTAAVQDPPRAHLSPGRGACRARLGVLRRRGSHKPNARLMPVVSGSSAWPR